MEHFVTLFNNLYIPQGLALHMSMERHVSDYVLWVVCVDDETFDTLGRLELPNVNRLKLTELETPDLLKVKPTRSIGEYCWTLTPFAPRFVFEADPTVRRVTYIDADLWFTGDAKPVLRELDSTEKQVLITGHAYAAEYDQTRTSGRYCVQFITFNRGGAEPVRRWWEERCIEWCFSRPTEGKFGDQKYLDDWAERFPSLVHVLQDKELALGPWNATRLPYGRAVFYHFHGVRLLSPEKIEIGGYIVPRVVIREVYQAYFADMKVAIAKLMSVGFVAKNQAEPASVIRKIIRKSQRVKAWLWPLLMDDEYPL